jgi:ankyrin repeat protein
MLKKLTLNLILILVLGQKCLALEHARGSAACACQVTCSNCGCTHCLAEVEVNPELNKKLILAATKGEEEYVDDLLMLKADPNFQSRSGMSPLMGAAKNGHLNIVKKLLAYGGIVSLKNDKGKIAYDFAQEESQHCASGPSSPASSSSCPSSPALSPASSPVDGLLSPDKERNYILIKHALLKQQLSELLIDAIKCPDLKLEEIKHILRLGADPNFNYGRNGETPLLLAVAKNSSEYHDVLKLLVEKNADVSHTDCYGTTPLMMAIDDNATDTVEFLLKNGADVHAQNMTGEHALLLAAKRNSVENVEKLLSLEADINVANAANVTALMFAASNGYDELVDLLIDKGAELETKDHESGMAALLAAADGGHLSTVQKLIEAGANYLVQNVSYRCLFDHAIFSRNKQLIDYVKALPVDVSCPQSSRPFFVSFAKFLYRTKSPSNLWRNPETGQLYTRCNTLQQSYDYWCHQQLSPDVWATSLAKAHKKKKFSFDLDQTAATIIEVDK